MSILKPSIWFQINVCAKFLWNRYGDREMDTAKSERAGYNI